MRKDLGMRKGKMISQGAHASLGCILNFISKTSVDGMERILTIPNQDVVDWLDGSFTKICLSVDSEDELIDIYKKAKESNLPCCLIEDNGLTEFHGIKTKTCCAIGPANSETIDSITGHLPLI
jgi:PTH2 family peptidyl-tRNA hydrolase